MSPTVRRSRWLAVGAGVLVTVAAGVAVTVAVAVVFIALAGDDLRVVILGGIASAVGYFLSAVVGGYCTASLAKGEEFAGGVWLAVVLVFGLIVVDLARGGRLIYGVAVGVVPYLLAGVAAGTVLGVLRNRRRKEDHVPWT